MVAFWTQCTVSLVVIMIFNKSDKSDKPQNEIHKRAEMEKNRGNLKLAAAQQSTELLES